MPTRILKPTLREKNRYVVVEIISDFGKFDKKAIQKAVWNSAFDLLGVFGVAKISLWLIDWDEKKQKGIIKVNRQSVKDIRVVIALISRIEGREVIPRICGVSGTIKAVRRKWM